MNEEITIERLIEDLDNLYGNDCFNYNREQSDKLANDIRNLIKQNKEKQDKLDKIEEKLNDYSCIYNQGFPFTLLLAIRGEHPNDNQYLELDKVIEDFRKIIKGEDK